MSAIAVGGSVVVLGGQSASRQLLPDLDQGAPWSVSVKRVDRAGQPRFLLVFGSTVENVGAGPLTVTASRRTRSARTMAADQAVKLADGGAVVVQGIGRLRYVRSEDHAHWHLRAFERYELRPAGHRAPVLRDRKTGFCLGDRLQRPGRPLPGRPRAAVFTGRCGLRSPDLMGIRQGISVGYGDPYDPELEGQYLDVTGLPTGEYLLVHRVNVDKSLRERNYRNNAASALLRLSRPSNAKKSRVAILATCPDSSRCALGPEPRE